MCLQKKVKEEQAIKGSEDTASMKQLAFLKQYLFPPFAQRKRLGTLTISAVTPIASYFAAHIEGITVKTS